MIDTYFEPSFLGVENSMGDTWEAVRRYPAHHVPTYGKDLCNVRMQRALVLYLSNKVITMYFMYVINPILSLLRKERKRKQGPQRLDRIFTPVSPVYTKSYADARKRETYVR